MNIINDISDNTLNVVKCLTLPDFFQEHASQKEQIIEAGLGFEGVYSKVKALIKSKKIKKNVVVSKSVKK